MWLIPSAIFWGSLSVVGYTYLGYPLVIVGLSKLRKRKTLAENIEPTISIILAAHNEEARIGNKIINLLDQGYPREKIELIVVDDGSTDKTAEIIGEFVKDGVRLVKLANSSGKPAAINAGMAQATGEIVVFCDARQRVEPGALQALVQHFADAQVGAVSGELMMGGEKGPGMYWKYEKLIRAAEGLFDSVVGATGAFYGIRRELWRELPAGCLLDDVFTPMQIMLRGYRVIFESEARVWDEEASLKGEFNRKARTLAGNFQLLQFLPELLNPLKNRICGQYVSHKLMRLVCPAALATLLGSNIWLVLTGAPGWPFYVLTLTAQGTAYALAAWGAIAGEEAGKLARVCHTFVTLNAAAVVAWKRWLSGDYGWTTTREQKV